MGVDRYASDCDGVVINVWGEAGYYQETSYSFDEQGNLLGFGFGDDVATECPRIAGAVCLPVGQAVRLCPSDGAAGAGGAGGVAGSPH